MISEWVGLVAAIGEVAAQGPAPLPMHQDSVLDMVIGSIALLAATVGAIYLIRLALRLTLPAGTPSWRSTGVTSALTVP